MKKAFITGITGQDGSYLADMLLEKGYQVHGLVRDLKSLPQSNIAHLLPNTEKKGLFLHQGSLENFTPLASLIEKILPDEIYHLASPSNVRLSLEKPVETLESIALGSVHFLETIKKISHSIKFLNAVSGEIFGQYQGVPHDESSPLSPITPYGAAKALAFQMTVIYRSVYKLPACSAILFSHESPRRKPEFVTRKIAQAVVKIKKDKQKELVLNNLTARRDWGWSPDYVQGMWMMLQQEKLDDYVLATGKSHSVEDFVRMAFEYVGLDWRNYVRCDASLMPIVEISTTCGNPSKAKQKLGWQCTLPLAEIVKRMVNEEMKKV